MLKPLVVAAAALAIAGSSVVYAQHRGGPDRDDSHLAHRHRLSPEDRAAFVDARIAALKAGLELTPDHLRRCLRANGDRPGHPDSVHASDDAGAGARRAF